ncbi:hypothetical protein K2Z83_27310 [Oscillochloris sp. ZM17-4]|uniref:hypothetical protein n=1 Tax=Oscillochloris sp. ZM17-4 TaxID=2866714 RepID=UPI001C72E441|nr:hypothetical protein [Oscillochloris sp. ZM17-4]MBX0331365.1 hypothetical protein [Oscillochloris sp. ZM17-4]
MRVTHEVYQPLIDRKAVARTRPAFIALLGVFGGAMSLATTVITCVQAENVLRGTWTYAGVGIGFALAALLFGGQWYFSEGPWWAYGIFLTPDVGITFAQTFPAVRILARAAAGVFTGDSTILTGIDWIVGLFVFVGAIISSYLPERVLLGQRRRRE